MQNSENVPSFNELTYLEALKQLSPREIQVLDLLIDGNTNQDIADELFLSKNTVETHKKNICQKLKLNNVRSLIKWGVKVKYKAFSGN
jgi:DNA-binding NarL/FixJ family response regulator